MMPVVTVVVAHREKSSRTTCLRLLQSEKGVQVVGEARTGLEAIAATIKFKPKILLLDLNLSKRNGIALIPVLRQKSLRTKIVLLTRHASKSRIMEALSHGSLGYLEEKFISTFLAKAVRLVDAGEAWVPRKMVARIIERLAHLTASKEGRKRKQDYKR